MKNRLAEHLTTWKAWYAIPAFFALLISSLIPTIGSVFLGGENSPAMSLLVPVQFIAIAVLGLGIIALLARRWPSRADLGLKKSLTWKQILLLIVVFAVSHLSFWLLALGGPSNADAPSRFFEEQNLGGPLLQAVAILFASVILAPVCEELLYRGAILRPIHDAIARRGSTVLAAVVSILVASVAFALPHLGDSLTGREAAAYMVTGIAFGLVYVLTGSMTAAMVSHSLQSCFAFGQILVLGHGDAYVSPILYILVFGCPVIVFFVARGLRAVFPKG